jgi:hypothetical protein
MVRQLLVNIALLIAVFLAAPAHAQAAPARIVAVGDLHGDFDAWIAILTDAKLIGPNRKWSGGKAVLVQTGDLVDRGPDSLKIIRHVQGLERQAKAAGGQVISLIGNHEAMMVSGDYRYVHPGEYAAFADRQSERRRLAAFEANKAAITAYYQMRDPTLASPDAIREAWIKDTPLGKVEHNTAWSPSGELGRWAASRPAVAKVGDTVFVHGGISGHYALVAIDEINKRVRDAVKAGSAAPDAITNEETGPLWYRGLATGTGSGGRTAQNELDVALQLFGAKRMVVGHTPDRKGIRFGLNQKLVMIDSGISTYYGGQLAWIEILGPNVAVHSRTRRK